MALTGDAHTTAPAAPPAPRWGMTTTRWLTVAVLVVVAVATSLPAVLATVDGRMVLGQNDFGWHIEQGMRFHLWPPYPPAPHFLFHLLVRITSTVLPGAPAVTAAAVVLALRVATAGALYAVLRNVFGDGGARTTRRAALFGTFLLLVIESPRVLLMGTDLTEGHAFIPIQTLFSATAQATLPFAILTPSLVVVFVRRATADRLTVQRTLVTVGVLLLGVLAKPSLAATLILPLPLWAYWYATGPHADRLRAARATFVRLCIPTLALLIFQVVHLSIWLAPDHRGGLAWMPFATARVWGAQHIEMWLALPLAFIGLIVAGRKWLGEGPVSLTLLGFAVGAAQFFLFSETGIREIQGNLGWGAQVCIYLLIVLSVRSLLATPWRSSTGSIRPRVVVCWALLAVALTAGVVATAGTITSGPIH